MKSQLLACAVCLTVCTGCQSTNLLSGRLGHGREDQLANLADASNLTAANSPGLPPPTNVDPRKSAESVSSVDDHLRQGETELRGGHEVEAQVLFEKALAIEPQHAKANHRMAVVCDKLGQYERAEKHYQIALQNDPRNVAVLSDLGYSYWLQGRYAESERHLLQARSIDPNYETAVANLGMLYGTTGRPEEALAMFRQIGDEAQVQQIMSQVTTLAARRGAPAATAGAMTPATLAGNLPAESAEPLKTDRDLNQVNGPTRELLELMEQGRRQQQLANQASQTNRPSQPQQQNWPSQQTSWPGEQVTQAGGGGAGAVPPYVRDRQMPQQPPTAQVAGVNGFQNQPQMVRPSGPHQVPTHLLNQALAEIDHEGRTPPSGPVSIGPQTRSPYGMASAPQQPMPPAAYPAQNAASPFPQQQLPYYEPDPSQMASTPASGSQGSRAPFAPPTTSPRNWNQPVPPSIDIVTSQPRDAVAGTPPIDQRPNPAAFATENMSVLPDPDPAQYASSATAGRFDSPPAARRGFDDARPDYRQEMPGAIQQASAMTTAATDDWSNDSSSSDAFPIEHAFHQQQAGSTSQIDLVQGSSAGQREPVGTAVDASSPSAEWGRPMVNLASKTNVEDPYQQARRQAAIMGLGAGPGQMFPYVQQTQRSAPGTDSRINGGQYPAPQRQLPTAMKPADLQAAFEDPRPANLTPPQNYEGQPLPEIVAPVNRPVQYGAASSGSFQQFQQTGGNPPDPGGGGGLQTYDNVRQQQGRQLTGLINQTYGQPPQSPPYNVAAPQSKLVNAPAGGQSNNDAWSLSPTPQPSNRATASVQSEIVIPEPYHMGSGTSAQRPKQRPASPAQFYGNPNDVPAIVPKTR